MLKSYQLELILYKKLSGILLKNGDKVHSDLLINSIFKSLVKKTKRSFSYIIKKIFLNLTTFVEVRNIVIKNNSYLVPFAIAKNRRYFLAAKWIVEAIKSNEQKISAKDKIVEECLAIYKSVNSVAISLLNKNNALALKNKSNSHYRW